MQRRNDIVIKLRHAGLVVDDMDKALHFYRDLLGLEIVKDALEAGPFVGHILGMPGVKVRTVKMRCGEEGLLELLDFGKDRAAGAGRELADHAAPDRGSALRRDLAPLRNIAAAGFTHLALTVKDLGALHGKLEAAGAVFVAAPAVSPDRRVKVAFCRDLEGN